MFREFFLHMSTNPLAKGATTRFPLSRRMVRRFVAGETLEEALRVVTDLNGRGFQVSLDPLGENVEEPEQAEAATADVLEIVKAIADGGLDAWISIKLTQAGLDIGDDFCRDNVRRMLDAAKEAGIFIRIDMEGTEYTQRTLDIHRRLREDGYTNVGTVIQSYLRRSAGDIADLSAMGAGVRLCKGAYKEPPDLAFPEKADVDRNYTDLLKVLLSPESRAKGTYTGIATHDQRMIDWALEHVESEKIGRDEFEFQMLYGIRRDLQEKLRADGYRMRIYVPYGSQWYPYFMRRLAERPANAIFLAKNMLTG